jgi:hypothetical protein
MKALLILGILLILWDPWIKAVLAKIKDVTKWVWGKWKASRLKPPMVQAKDSDIEIHALVSCARKEAGYSWNRDSRFAALKTLATKYPYERKAKEQMAWSISHDSYLSEYAMKFLDQMTKAEPKPLGDEE